MAVFAWWCHRVTCYSQINSKRSLTHGPVCELYNGRDGPKGCSKQLQKSKGQKCIVTHGTTPEAEVIGPSQNHLLPPLTRNIDLWQWNFNKKVRQLRNYPIWYAMFGRLEHPFQKKLGWPVRYRSPQSPCERRINFSGWYIGNQGICFRLKRGTCSLKVAR